MTTRDKASAIPSASRKANPRPSTKMRSSLVSLFFFCCDVRMHGWAKVSRASDSGSSGLQGTDCGRLQTN
jgi:hypothetical protein